MSIDYSSIGRIHDAVNREAGGNPEQVVLLSPLGMEKIRVPFYVYEANEAKGRLVVSQVPSTLKGNYPRLTFDKNSLENEYVIVEEDMFRKVVDKNVLCQLIKDEAMVRIAFAPRTGIESHAVGRFYGFSRERMSGRAKYFFDLGMIPERYVQMPKLNLMKGDAVKQRRKKLTGRRFGIDTVTSFPIEKPFLEAIVLE